MTYIDLWLLQCSVEVVKYSKLFWTGCLKNLVLARSYVREVSQHFLPSGVPVSIYGSLPCLSSAIPPPAPAQRHNGAVSGIQLFPLSVPFCCGAFEFRKPYLSYHREAACVHGGIIVFDFICHPLLL